MRPKYPIPVDQLGEEVQKIGDVLTDGTDLAVALVATSFLDECLRSLLATVLRPGDTTDTLLRSGRGVIGTFSARTDLAYSLGLIDKHELAALRQVAEIRNAFAHSHVSAEFTDPDIISLCEKLTYPYELHVNRWSKPEERESKRQELDKFFQKTRERFSYSCVLLGQTLIHAARKSARSAPPAN